MTLGAMLVWPAAATLGFFVMTALVVVLGAGSTARYEFERNGASAPQPAPAGGPIGNHPAGRRAPAASRAAAEQAAPQAVALAVRPAPAPAAAPAWWLVDESAQVLAGPFADRVDADWAALADGLAAVAVFGARRHDGGVTRRPSPEGRAWDAELGGQLDRLPRDWDDVLSDTDPLTTLVVEVVAAVV